MKWRRLCGWLALASVLNAFGHHNWLFMSVAALYLLLVVVNVLIDRSDAKRATR